MAMCSFFFRQLASESNPPPSYFCASLRFECALAADVCFLLDKLERFDRIFAEPTFFRT